ncbi:hypothetical protein [uncultured Roseobacter sp.]|uniref:hypothetical protein n=1 Tax=uncultured Roseobacter sp. TaxID=114847 RepID=UPI0026330B51|nr:hypothetical protein [uncultured Roseobacter sp.]
MVGVTALTVYQETLDVLSNAIMTDDTGTALARTKLPHLHRTLSSEVVVETPEDLVKGILAFGQAVKGLGATNLVRLATEAEFLSENYIAGYHVTHTLRDAVPVVDSYASRMVLLREDGVWKMLEVESMLDNPHWPIYIPRVHHHAGRTQALASPENDARKQAVHPLTIYQSFIEDLSAANTEDDFETYCSYLLFPYTSHTEFADTIIATPEDVRPFFDMLRDTMREKSCDRLVRRAEDAEFISSDLICGYHATEFCAGETCVFGPIKSRMILKRENTNWYLKSVTNSLANSRFPYNVPKPSNALVTLRTIQERTRT